MSSAGIVPEKTDPPPFEQSDFSRPTKRARVAVACTRCKSRKQKCDGSQPQCSNCKNLSIACEYIVPSRTLPHGKYQYIKALEARVAELEGIVAAAGLTDSGKEAWDNVADDTNPAEQASARSNPKQTDDLSILEATQYLRDLSLQAGGGFVGDESSNITVGHIFATIVQSDIPKRAENKSPLGARSLSERRISVATPGSNPLAQTSPETAEILLNGYLKHISTRWVVLYRPHLIHIHNKNHREGLVDPFEISTLNIAYAIGGRFLETVGEPGSFNPDLYYQAALEHLESILQASDVASVQTLLLHAIYCLRAPRGLSAWTNVGLASRICASLGLHRKTPSEKPSLAVEIKKRIFWSCYCLDRQVSIILGRPFAISDRDIDAELPLDISDSLSDAAIQALPSPDPNQQSTPSTSLSCFIHVVRLRRIESHIQQSIYRVDKHKPLVRAKIDGFLESLDLWRNHLPPEFTDSDTETYSYDGIRYYEIYYYKCLRLLLYPQLSSADVDPDIIMRCADACGGVCRTYKSLHRETDVGFSLMAIYAIFLSGLTLLYCLWLSPLTIYNTGTMNDLNACSIVLYVIAERWPGARRYRDAFEVIKQSVLGLLEQGQSMTNKAPLPGLATRGLREFGAQGLHPEGVKEYSQMLNDMAGSTPSSQVSPPSGPQTRPARSASLSSQVSSDAPASNIITAAPQLRFSYSYPPRHFPQQQYHFPGPYNMQQQVYDNQGGAEMQGQPEIQDFRYPGMSVQDSLPQNFPQGESGPSSLPTQTGLPDDFDLGQFMGHAQFGTGQSDMQ